MRILWRRPEPILILRKWLNIVAKNVQFAIIIPFALCAILCYPLMLSLQDVHRPCILSQQGTPPENSSVGHMKQAAFIPPVFVDAFDPKLAEVIGPLKKLHDDIGSSNSSCRLFSLYNGTTTPDSQFITPRSPTAQGLLFTFVYENEQESNLWEAALDSISNGKNPQNTPSYFVDREELLEAEAAALKSPDYSPWPGACVFSRTVLTALTLAISLYIITWLHTTTAYRPWVFIACMGIRASLGVLSAISLVSLFYPDFDVRTHYRFLWIILMAVFIGIYQSIRLVNTIESGLNSSQTALNRLISGYQQSFRSVLEIILVQVLLVTLAKLCRHSATQPFLSPLTAFMVIYITVDITLHYTFFAAVTYINMLSLETYDLACGPPYKRRKSSLFKFCCINVASFQQTMGHIFGYVLYLPVIFYAGFYYNGGYFLLKVHPNIKHLLSKPVYIDSFVHPLDESLNGYSFVEIFKPIVFDIDSEFSAPTGRVISSIGTLRYGNTFTLILEMFCIKLFFSSLCMIVLLLLTDNKVLSFTTKAATGQQEGFHEATIGIESSFDIVKISCDGHWISVLSLDGTFKVVDFTSMSVFQRRILPLPAVKNPWAVNQLLLSASGGISGTLYRSKIELWNISSGRQYYELDYSQVLSAPPLATAFVNTTLLFISDAGRLIESYTTKAPQVYVLTREVLRWAFFHQAGHDTKAVLCDTKNSLYFCKRSEGDKAAWTTSPLTLSPAFLASQETSGIEPSSSTPPPNHWTEEYQECGEIISALCAPDIHIWIAFTNTKVIFVDLLTGVILRIAEFGRFKPGTARVLHTQPTHCVFCGATAISSLTIAYESLLNKGELICQTWKMSGKDYEPICLRTEWDTHDGLFAAEVTTVRIQNVRTWAPTKINLIMGLRSPEGLDDYPEGWEAFATSVTTGSSTEFMLDEDALETQLLTSSPGQAEPLGPKSICIPFGNTLKILYLQG